jgi:hypothetical protein
MQLKDVGKMSNLPGLSTLALSRLWGMDVDKIHASQIQGFVWRMNEQGQKDAAETAIHICFNELRRAVDAGVIERPQMLDFTTPTGARMTVTELRDGLLQLGKEKAAALLFALETGMTGHDVGRLTWVAAARMMEETHLSERAIACTQVCPRQPTLQYVFWQTEPGIGAPAPLFQLEADVFEAFMLMWPELVEAYKYLLMVDGDADALDLRARLGRPGG